MGRPDAAGWASDGDLTLVTTLGSLGMFLALHNGLLVGRLSARPRWPWARSPSSLDSARSPPSRRAAALAAFGLFLVGQGSVTTFLAALTPNVANFAEADQGKAHGVLLAGFGGSSALLAGCFGVFFGGDDADGTSSPPSSGPAGTSFAVALTGAVLTKDDRSSEERRAPSGPRRDGDERRSLFAGAYSSDDPSDGDIHRRRFRSFARGQPPGRARGRRGKPTGRVRAASSGARSSGARSSGAPRRALLLIKRFAKGSKGSERKGTRLRPDPESDPSHRSSRPSAGCFGSLCFGSCTRTSS